MIKNMLVTSYRHLRKNKLFAAINILSLSIGISATLVIFLMVHHDYSFDKHLPDGDRVYRPVSAGEFKTAAVLVPLIRAMEEDLPGVDAVVPLLRAMQPKIKTHPQDQTQTQVFPSEQAVIFSNSAYFDVFPHEWLAGNALSLNEPNTLVLSEENLIRYYPELTASEALGKTLLFSDSILMEITGIYKETKANSDFKYNVIFSVATIANNENLRKLHSWDGWNQYMSANQALLLLNEKSNNPKQVEEAIAKLIETRKPKTQSGSKDHFVLQPLSDVHFNADYNYSAAKTSTLRNLMLLALFLLILGAINFINLSTAQSIDRAKEVGIRKTLGSRKNMLVRQFLTETFLITFAATLFSILLLPILLQAFSGFIPKAINIYLLPWNYMSLFLIAQLIVITVLAGFYPAWVMTNFAPALALKNQISKNNSQSRSALIRKGLTVFQFIIAQIFLISVLVVSKQISYAINKDMGFQKEAIVNFYVMDGLFNPGSDKPQVLKNKLAEIPEVKALSLGNQSPAFDGSMSNSMSYDDHEDSEISFDSRNGDTQYLDVYQIPLIAGRNIRLLDSGYEALINESMLSLIKVDGPEDALGKTFGQGAYTIVGVMKDFNIESIHSTIRPTMYWGEKRGYVMHIALDKDHPATWKRALEKITAAFNEIYPEEPFEYTFLDETVAKFYQTELQLSRLLQWSVGLSILIACLGLLGLALFITKSRTKEIGIRKILGASVGQLVYLLGRNLLILVLIASLIAIPIAWYFLHQWLDNFAYKTAIDWWIFAVSCIGMLLIAGLILATKTIQAAVANPVDALRDE